MTGPFGRGVRGRFESSTLKGANRHPRRAPSRRVDTGAESDRRAREGRGGQLAGRPLMPAPLWNHQSSSRQRSPRPVSHRARRSWRRRLNRGRRRAGALHTKNWAAPCRTKLVTMRARPMRSKRRHRLMRAATTFQDASLPRPSAFRRQNCLGTGRLFQLHRRPQTQCLFLDPLL
jgi:hypothetical protein